KCKDCLNFHASQFELQVLLHNLKKYTCKNRKLTVLQYLPDLIGPPIKSRAFLNAIGFTLAKDCEAFCGNIYKSTGTRLGLEAKKKEYRLKSWEENPKDDNSILWRGSLKVAIVTEPCVSFDEHILSSEKAKTFLGFI
ncbi:hypothetical protein Avbf_07298, partial [Armadillidium vulgare]